MTILKRRDKNAIAHLQMNAPERLNALSDEMIAAFQSQLDALKDDKNIRAVIISGAGKAFCAGHDLQQMTAGRQREDEGKAYFHDLFNRCAKMMQTIQTLPQPVIAQVHGIATAAGCQLVASCDMAVAAEDARFGVNGVDIGLFCSTPMVALSRNIPRKHAFEMLTTGNFIAPSKAESLGLINRVVPAAELETQTHELAETVAQKLGLAVKIGKEAFYDQLHLPIDEAYEHTGNIMVENMLWRETEAGIAAFLNKETPTWEQ